MRVVPTKIHGVLDYLVAAILIATPWLFGFSGHTNACYVPIVLGLTAILYSALTNYEMGIIKVLSMPTHLILDYASGVILACSPWLFSFNDSVYLPHLVIGILIICISLMTIPVAYKKRAGNLIELGHRP